MLTHVHAAESCLLFSYSTAVALQSFCTAVHHMYQTKPSPTVHPASQALNLNIPQPTLRLQVFLPSPSHPALGLKGQYGLNAVCLADVLVTLICVCVL